MKSGLRSFLVIWGISFVIALAGSYVVYRFFPQYLCYTVYNVSASELYEKEEKAIVPGAQYTEYFVPQNSYLKSIVISLGLITEEDTNGGQHVRGKLVNAEGKIIAESEFQTEPSEEMSFYEFKIEKWVESGQEYGLVIEFPDCEGVLVTFAPEDAGPEEHRKLFLGNEASNENMYMQYVYGSFSKKLLMMWFLVFFVSSCFLGECFVRHGKK